MAVSPNASIEAKFQRLHRLLDAAPHVNARFAETPISILMPKVPVTRALPALAAMLSVVAVLPRFRLSGCGIVRADSN